MSVSLLRQCHEGTLEGGLSVAMDVRPDELLGPLLQRMGDHALKLRVYEVQGLRPMTLSIHFEGVGESWAVDNLSELVAELNHFFRLQPTVRAIVELGEWEDMLQLWCVRKTALRGMLRERSFSPLNRNDLARLFG